MIEKYIKEIEFDDMFSNEYGTTLYFAAPEEMYFDFSNDFITDLEEEYGGSVVGTEISIEFPDENFNSEEAEVSVAITIKSSDGEYHDEEWRDIYLESDDIEKLITIYKNNK